MALATRLLPEEFLVAILHKVGPRVRIVDDARLAKIFDDAAEKYGGAFRQFAGHPLHHYSKRLSEALQTLDDGGSITRENPANDYFLVTPHTAGSYGELLFQQLRGDDPKAVMEVSEAIRSSFGG